MLNENLGLLTCRQQNKMGFYHAFACNTIIESCVVSNRTREINYLFPLYVYSEFKLFNSGMQEINKEPNINPKIIQALYDAYKKEMSPEEIFYYIYAVLYSNLYRQKYSEFLRMDFPRVPFTSDCRLFSRMAELGKRLVEVHLLKSDGTEPPMMKFQGEGDNQVEIVRYENNRVYINRNQYFEPVLQNVWEYKIGGYQVCDKWLKERKGKKLSLEDIMHYCKIIAALKETITLQSEIDKIFPELEKNLLDL